MGQEEGSRPQDGATEKFAVLKFYDPSDKVVYMVHPGNLHWQSHTGYRLLGLWQDDSKEQAGEPELKLLCKLIRNTKD